MSTWNALLPIITLLIGGVLAYYGQRAQADRQNRAALVAAEAAAERERRRELEIRRETFELTHLVDVQRALMHADTVASRLFNEAMHEAGKTGEFRERVSDPEFSQASRDLQAVYGFVLDDEVRARVGEVFDAQLMYLMGKADIEDEPKIYAVDYVKAYTTAHTAIARRVREIYKTKSPSH